MKGIDQGAGVGRSTGRISKIPRHIGNEMVVDVEKRGVSCAGVSCKECGFEITAQKIW